MPGRISTILPHRHRKQKESARKSARYLRDELRLQGEMAPEALPALPPKHFRKKTLRQSQSNLGENPRSKPFLERVLSWKGIWLALKKKWGE